MTMTIGGTSGLVFPDSSTQNTAATGFGFKNRIINGAMMIDQRNAGASISAGDGSYAVDRFTMYHASGSGSKGNIQQNQGSVTPPSGFTNYYGFTTTSAYSVGSGDGYAIQHRIEGLNMADLGWGTANAQTVTFSFWVRSSLTGTFGGSIVNGGANYSYPFSYTISAANTWEQKTITIAGPTSGTWLTTNGVGAYVSLSIGTGTTYSGTAGSWSANRYWSATGATSVVGTNGATFYITGVQLEKGSTATSFDYRPYGTELALCKRYYEKSYDIGTVAGTATTLNCFSYRASGTSPTLVMNIRYEIEKRAIPTFTTYNPSTGASGSVRNDSAGSNATVASIAFNGTKATPYISISGAAADQQAYIVQFTAEAEL